MFNIKFSFWELSKKIGFTIISIIQLAITFTFLYNIVYVKNQVSNTTEKVISTFSKDNIYTMDAFYGLDDIYDKKDADYLKFYNYLKNNKDIIHCTAYTDHVLLKTFENNNFLLTNNYAPIKEGHQYYPIKALKVDYNYINEFKYNIIEGQGLDKNDFSENRNEIPILLGINYKGIYNLNDKLEYYDYKYGKKNLIVKGFIDKGYNSIGKIIESKNVISLDNYIIFPIQNYTNTDDDFQVINSTLQSYLIINSNDVNSTLINIEENALKDFGEIKLTDINDNIKNYLEKYKIEEDILKVIFFIVFLMCFIGIMTNMINYINNNMKVFAINLLNGARILDIQLIVFYQIFIIVFSSLILSISGIHLLQSLNFVEWMLEYFLQLFMIALLIILILIIIPSIYIKKLSINTLLRRE